MQLNGVELLAMGYKYNMQNVLSFIFMKDAGSLAIGDPYIAQFPDKFGNVKTIKFPRPAVISRYFNSSNVVDSHNQSRQYCLKLEKLWITQDP
jgi:hypothetical protein